MLLLLFIWVNNQHTKTITKRYTVLFLIFMLPLKWADYLLRCIKSARFQAFSCKRCTVAVTWTRTKIYKPGVFWCCKFKNCYNQSVFKMLYLERQTPSFCPDLDAFFMVNSNNVPNNFLQIKTYISDKLTQGTFCARPKPDNFCCTVLIYTLSEWKSNQLDQNI